MPTITGIRVGPLVATGYAIGATVVNFTLGPIRPWLPSDLAHVTHWWDANNAASFNAASGAITSWAPRFGTGTLTQATAANRPTRGASTQNGLPVIAFDGVNDALILADGSGVGNTTRGSMTVAIAATFSGTGGTSTLISRGTSGLDGYWNFDQGAAGGRFSIASASGTGSVNGATADTTTFRTRIGTQSGLSVRFYRDGTNYGGVGTIPVMPGTTAGEFRLGCRVVMDPATQYGPGLIGDVVIVGEALTTADRQRLEGYLAHKWGTVAFLPADHPYRDAPPVTADDAPAGTTADFAFTPSAIAEDAAAGTSVGSLT